MFELSSEEESHQTALRLSQNAPQYLEKSAIGGASGPFSFLSGSESLEAWTTYEQLLLSCLRTKDDKSALLCLKKLISRFGPSSERLAALQGLYEEATAADDLALDKLLSEYETIILNDPTNTHVLKRRVALLQDLSRQTDAIEALTELLETSPTDVEAWAELSDLYVSQAMYPQAIFCLEEVLLIAPNAWNIHARLGEISYLNSLSSSNSNEAAIERLLVAATRHYCRSIELCEGYLRGLYGLKLTTDRFLEVVQRDDRREGAHKANSDATGSPSLPLQDMRMLNKKTTKILKSIVRGKEAGNFSHLGYSDSEVGAVKDLLGMSS
ncbi:MAG: hypothetical protein MMC33_006393 [Icmadophila ericetorum]|nr:hypothetical protein [Icmadophila ericetorum]